MDKKPVFQVTNDEAGMRLDNFIFKQRRQVSKSVLYKLIRKGQVRLNGKRCKPEIKVVVGDEVRLPPFLYFDQKEPVQIPETSRQKLLPHVLFENDDYLLLNKPAGLPCHVGTGHEFGVIEIIQSIPQYGQVQLAHRLDIHTSGCLLLAKQRQALLAFQAAMKSQQVAKIYAAKLVGKLAKATTVDLPLDTSNRVKDIRKVIPSHSGKLAETTFKPVKYDAQHTWVLCHIKHGRTHQIRAHAASIGMPIVGDTWYGAPPSNSGRRIYLHAQSLAFGEHSWQCDPDF